MVPPNSASEQGAELGQVPCRGDSDVGRLGAGRGSGVEGAVLDCGEDVEPLCGGDRQHWAGGPEFGVTHPDVTW